MMNPRSSMVVAGVLLVGLNIHISLYGIWPSVLHRMFTTMGAAKDTVVTNAQRLAKQVEQIKHDAALYAERSGQVRARVEQLARDLAQMQTQRDTSKQGQFYTKKMAVSTQQHAVLSEQEETIQRILNLLERQRVLIQDQLAGMSSNESTQQEQQRQALYGFHDIQAALQELSNIQGKLAEEEKTRAASIDELAKRRKTLTLAEADHVERKLEQENFAALASSTVRDELTPLQQGSLIDSAERLAWYKQELAQLKVVESEHKVALADIQVSFHRVQLTEAKRRFSRIRKSARVSKDFVKQADEMLEQKRAAMLFARERTNEKLRLVGEQQAQVQERLRAEQVKNAHVTLDIANYKLLQQPAASTTEWLTELPVLGSVIDMLLHQVEYEFLTAQSDFESAKFRKDEIETAIIRSWHRITTREARFKSDEEVEQEIKSFEIMRSELEGQLTSLASSLDAAVSRLDLFNTTFDRVRKLVLQLSQQKLSLFGRRQDEYTRAAEQLDVIEEKARRLLHWGGRLFEIYSATAAMAKNNIHKVDGMVHELSSRAFWRRSDFSIDLSDLKSFVPDMQLFIRDLHHAAVSASLSNAFKEVWLWLANHTRDHFDLLLLIIKLCLLIGGFFLARMLIPPVAQLLRTIGKEYILLRWIAFFGSAVLVFIGRHLLPVYIWFVTLCAIRMHIITHQFAAQVFYLLSIPFGLWLVWKFVAHCVAWNREQRYAVISEPYERRFFFIVWLLLSATVVLLNIREAFLRGDYAHSPVPSVLFALLFVIGQVSAIALIGRSQIVGLIPADTPLREWIHEQLNRYYYVIWCFFIAVIVMSTPLVGYGRQVYYIISRLLLSAALISLLSWIHNSVKRGSLDLFFYYADRDVVKERFVTGRFWYSIFVVSTLALFLALGIYATAKVWGYPIGIREMLSWLQYPFYNPIDEASGKIFPVSILSILYIILYLLGGFVIAYVINVFVISRVLDPFIVEPGVQSTVLTLLRYVILLLALFMGLSSTGLEGLMLKFGLVLAALSFAIKDIVSDFCCYFILLVQRPVKVGDFIRVLDPRSNDDNVSLTGFVRAITPRSIIIRKRNSTTVIIPNSHIVTTPVMNWSYSRGFFAFDDMRITVPYGVDPQEVRQLFAEVLDKSTQVLKNPAPVIRLEDFVDNGYSFMVRGYLTSHKIGEQWDIASEVRFQLVKALRERGIEVGSPTRTVRLTSAEQRLFQQITRDAERGEGSGQ